MAISMDLRVLARKLEKSSDDLLVDASTKGPETFEKVASAIAAASTLLTSVADDIDKNASFKLTPQQLDEMAALASAFDESADPLLKKQASVLDEILLSIAAPRNAGETFRKVQDEEIARLRTEHRRARGEEAYIQPKKEHHDMWNSAAQAKAVEQQVKHYIPMEAPLQTRYPPDRPGGQMTRISDGVYQDIETGIIYDYKAGYTTQKGNKVPGGSVENQTRQLGDYRNQSASLFETRESLMGRYASEEVVGVLKIARDKAPHLLPQAIDCAFDAGLSTAQVSEILANGAQDSNWMKVTASDHHTHEPLSEKESLSESENSKGLISQLVDAGPMGMSLVLAEAVNMARNGVWLKHIRDVLISFGLEAIYEALAKRLNHVITEKEKYDYEKDRATIPSLGNKYKEELPPESYHVKEPNEMLIGTLPAPSFPVPPPLIRRKTGLASRRPAP